MPQQALPQRERRLEALENPDVAGRSYDCGRKTLAIRRQAQTSPAQTRRVDGPLRGNISKLLKCADLPIQLSQLPLTIRVTDHINACRATRLRAAHTLSLGTQGSRRLKASYTGHRPCCTGSGRYRATTRERTRSLRPQEPPWIAPRAFRWTFPATASTFSPGGKHLGRPIDGRPQTLPIPTKPS